MIKWPERRGERNLKEERETLKVFQVLFYGKAGHFAIHTDYLHFLYPYDEIKRKDLKAEYRVSGNRIATIVIGLQRSEKGIALSVA